MWTAAECDVRDELLEHKVDWEFGYFGPPKNNHVKNYTSYLNGLSGLYSWSKRMNILISLGGNRVL